MRSIYHIREYNFRRLALVRLAYIFMSYLRLNVRYLAFEATGLPLTRLAGVYRTSRQSGGSAATETLLQG